MASRMQDVADVQRPIARRRDRPEQADVAGDDLSAPLARAALTFAVRCHCGQRRNSDGASFIEHPLEVARLLRDAGCSEVLVAAGLLHDVGDCCISAHELHARFGSEVADLVQVVSDHASSDSYRQRKQVLRDQVRDASRDAAMLFAADKIAEVRELPGQVRRDQSRFGDSARGGRMRIHLAHYHQMRLEHYVESLAMLQRAVPKHPLVRQLASELDRCAVASAI